jgi:hypothetical protein
VVLALFLFQAAGQPGQLMAAADLFIKDCPADVGAEPNGACSVYYLSEDIWVRQNPMSGYQMVPFAADPAWLTSVSPLHQNPEYRDPKFSKPNYLYVRVRNRGSTASTGLERLRVYWAKASTGLSWPAQWVDNIDNVCGPNRLYGIEITKPRKNGATATAGERSAYVNSIVSIDSAAYQWLMDGVTYWDKQDHVHQLAPEHGTPAFLPWHREFIHRYEVVLREANPIVTLLYWDWTTDPANSTGGFNMMTTSFMGIPNGVVGAPFSSLHANGNCANSRNGFTFPGGPNCNMHFNDWTYPPPNLYRSKGAGLPSLASDLTVLSPTTYQSFDGMEGNPHGNAHVYMGGNMGSIPTACEDPLFFMLHANCDRLWATWQRTNNPAYIGRLNPATAYDGESGNARINATMQPWDGSSAVAPWMPGAGSYTYSKTPKDPSVVFPPVYDTAPLRIPALQAGESIVVEIPWYPPNPADFACFGTDQGHVCLLARIETATASPFGMTFLEGSNIGDNVRNNNNIAWKNVTVQDSFPGLLFVGSVLIRNLALQDIVPTRIQLRIPPEERQNPLLNYGGVYLDLGEDLFDRWQQAGGVGQGIEPLGNGRVQLFGFDAFIAGLPLRPGEVQQIRMELRLDPQYRHPDGQVFNVDLEQYAPGPAGNEDELVGGQRFTFDFNKLTLVPKGSRWRYLDTGEYPGDGWQTADFDDSKWRVGQAELGFGDNPVTMIDGGPQQAPNPTAWFRHEFMVDDPSIYRSVVLGLKLDDGIAIYLNGELIHQAGLPANFGPDTFADVNIQGVEEETCFIIPAPRALELLRRGSNVLAAEVHQSKEGPEDLTFALEMSANTLAPALLAPPSVRIPSPRFGSLHLLGRPIPIQAEAIDPNGTIQSVSFFADEKILGTVQQPPYAFNWTDAPLGMHQIRALALDNDGLGSTAFVDIKVLSNVPPVVTILSPIAGTLFDVSDPIHVTAEASDVAGKVERVDYYLRHHHAFGIGDLVGTSDGEPYALDLPPLEPGDYVVTAEATDDGGMTAISLPVEFDVVQRVRPVLQLQRINGTLVLTWIPPNAILQVADNPAGPWTDMLNAATPLNVTPDGTTKFYRAFLP